MFRIAGATQIDLQGAVPNAIDKPNAAVSAETPTTASRTAAVNISALRVAATCRNAGRSTTLPMP